MVPRVKRKARRWQTAPPATRPRPVAASSEWAGERLDGGEVMMVRRSLVAPCLTCGLCGGILRDATTVSECLHSFCRKCIFQKLEDENIKCCPTCTIDLGCAPLEKLRADRSLLRIRLMVFPAKRRRVEEIPPSDPALVSLPSPSRAVLEGYPSAKKTGTEYFGINVLAEMEELKAFDQHLQEIMTLMRKLEERNRLKNQLLENLTSRVEAHESTITDLKNALRDRETENERLRQELRQVKDENYELRGTLNARPAIKLKEANRLEELEKRMPQLEKQMKGQEHIIEALSMSNTHLKAEVGLAKRRVESMQGQLTKAQEALSHANSYFHDKIKRLESQQMELELSAIEAIQYMWPVNEERGDLTVAQLLRRLPQEIGEHSRLIAETSAAHTLATVKSHYPGIDEERISTGFACPVPQAIELVNQMKKPAEILAADIATDP